MFVAHLVLAPLTLAQVPEALALDAAALGGLWTAEGYTREIDSPNSDLLLLQAVPLANAPTPHQPPLSLALGCAWAIVEEAHITVLAVHPDYQRQGLGQLMLWALLQAACDRHLERATLEVRVSNQAAIALYTKFGFKIAGTRKRYYQDNGEDALVLWLNGLHQPAFQHCLANWQNQLRDRLQPQWHCPLLLAPREPGQSS